MGVARVLMKLLSTEVDVNNGITLQVLPRLDPATLAAGSCATLLALSSRAWCPCCSPRASISDRCWRPMAAERWTRWRGRRYLIAMQVTASVLLVAVAAALRRRGAAPEPDRYRDRPRRLALARIDFGSQRYDEDRARHVAENAVRQIGHTAGCHGRLHLVGVARRPHDDLRRDADAGRRLVAALRSRSLRAHPASSTRSASASDADAPSTVVTRAAGRQSSY